MEISSRPPRQLFWLLQISGWLALMLPSAIIAGLLFSDSLSVLVIGLLRQVLGFGLTLGLWQIYRRWPADGFKLTAHVPAILLACTCVTGLDVALTETVRRVFHAPPLPDMAQFGAVFVRVFLYGAWSSLYFGLRQEIQSRATAARLAEAIAANREAELQLLHAQLNPEFFLNGLNTVITEAKAGNSTAVIDTAQAVGDYLRYALNQGTRTHFARLGGELEAIAGYLRAERARLGPARFDWQIEAAKEVRNISVPTMLLQPLIENALKHGLPTSPPPLRLGVDAHVQAGELVVIVEHSGSWITHPATRETGASTVSGLDNLRRRLALLYDQHARLDVTTLEGCVRVVVRLPVTVV